jgi:hypothetical protein
MTRPVNLASPDFEPTDEELTELSRRAFSTVAARSDAATNALRERIATEQAQVLARLETRLAEQAGERSRKVS